MLGVDSTHVYRSYGKKRLVAGTAAEIANTLKPSDWKRLSAGEGTKGPRLHDWCYLELADLDADEFNEANHGLWTRGFLLRRNIDDGELAYFMTWCPAGTRIETLVNVEGQSTHPQKLSALIRRWSIQEIRRIAQRLKQHRTEPAFVIAWSLWRRAHQAAARRAHLKQKSQL